MQSSDSIPEENHQLPDSAQSNTSEIEQPTANDSTPNPNDQMEVHHHGHVHETKKWKEYLFQFLMLFLAVTAGFFMENQREHYIEGHRAKVMAGSLIEDLKKDSAEVSNMRKQLGRIISGADSLMQQLDKPRNLQNDSIIQILGSRLMTYNYFDSQSGTYQQIKNSGSLRYFKPELSILMTNYETNANYIAKLSSDAMIYRQTVVIPFMMTFRNGRFIKSIRDSTRFQKPYFKKEPSDESLNTLYNMAYTLHRNYEHYIDRCEEHRKLAEGQMEALRKEYKI